MKRLFLILIISTSLQGVCQNTRSKEGIIVDNKRINKVREYYENGQLKLKGKEKGKKEWVGCLGWRKVYKKNGRWKYYNQQGDLMKIVKYKDGKEMKIIHAINR